MKNVVLIVMIMCGVASFRSLGVELFSSRLIRSPDEVRRGAYFELGEQFTRFGTLQNSGREVERSADEYLNDSVTQATLGYNFTRSFGVEAEVPFIYREYRRLRRFEIEEDRTSGVGDISLFAHWMILNRAYKDGFISLKVSGGLDLPSGDNDRLSEESEAPSMLRIPFLTEPGRFRRVPNFLTVAIIEPGTGRVIFVRRQRGVRLEYIPAKYGERLVTEPERSIRGNDLALGSGSVDGVLRANLQARWKQLFFAADAQYSIPSEGEFDYRFAPQFEWRGGPGIYTLDSPDFSLAVQVVCSGETKGEDEFRGHRQNDTALTAVFLGPSFTACWRDRLRAQISAELPVHVDNSGFQVVPDYRIQASVSWQF